MKGKDTHFSSSATFALCASCSLVNAGLPGSAGEGGESVRACSLSAGADA
jgi:hypothetical protein